MGACVSDQYIQTKPIAPNTKNPDPNVQTDNPFTEGHEAFRLVLEEPERAPKLKKPMKKEALSLHHHYGLDHDPEDDLIMRPSTRDPWNQNFENSKPPPILTEEETKFKPIYTKKKNDVYQKPRKKTELPPFVYGNEPIEYENVHLEVKGAQLLTNGKIYVGEWLGNRMHGKGVLTDVDGGKFEGFFYENRMHGRGRYTSIIGEIYEGEWKENEREGYGNLYLLDGASYSGEWKKGEKHGYGEENISNGDGSFDRYFGNYEKGQKHGSGKYMWANGDVYEGEFFEDKKQGRGEWSFANKRKYTGEFFDDMMHGKGVFEWPELVGNEIKLTVYKGEYRANRKEGEGEIIWAEGRTYNGSWKDGKQDGCGTMKWKDGTVYEGNWARGKQEGEGKMIWPDGRIYTGTWREGKEDGNGVMKYSNGMEEKRRYRNGVLV